MPYKSIRLALVLLLMMVVAASAVSASPLQVAGVSSDRPSLFSRLADLVGRRLSWEATKAAEHGCTVDPDGERICPSTPKHGCSIDPNGKPVCTP